MNVPGNREPAAGAVETLRQVDDVRRTARRQINAAWFPLLLWGAIVLVSAPIGLGDEAILGVYWTLAAPTGLLLTAVFFRRRGFEGGFEPRHWRVDFSIGVAIAVACALLGSLGGEMVSAVGPMYAVAAGLSIFAVLHRDAAFGFAVLALTISASMIVVADPGEPRMIAAIFEGLLLLSAGFTILIVARLGEDDGVGTARPQSG